LHNIANKQTNKVKTEPSGGGKNVCKQNKNVVTFSSYLTSLNTRSKKNKKWRAECSIL